MPDNKDTSQQNPNPEENSQPTNPQEPTEPALENTAHSEPANAPPEAPESSPNDFSVKSNDIPLSTSIPTEAVNELKTEEKQTENEPTLESEIEQNSEPVEIPEPETAQIPGNEPFKPTKDNPANESEAQEPEISEPENQEIEPKPLKEEKPEETKIYEPISKPKEVKPEPEKPKPIPVIVPTKNSMRELLVKARLAIQNRKRKKLEKVMSLFLKQSKITNDEVEKFLHVSDATATRYLSQLEKEGKIKQNGKTGHMVSYSRI